MPYRLAISTVSLGWHASHTLEAKITAVKEAGFEGIELFITDLDAYATRHKLSHVDAAREIRQLCTAASLEIVTLGSFDNFEGSQTPLQDRLDKASEWLDWAHALGTNVIQIPSNDSKDALGDEGTVVAEFRALSDLAAQRDPPVSFAYEALAWGTHVADWEEALRVVTSVDRRNFGLCLDTYHILARVWADARAASGVRPGARAALRDSLQRLSAFWTSSQREQMIVYVQLSDAERMLPPILPGHPVYHEEKDVTHSWCSYGRLFPLETESGAYFPFEEVVRAWLGGGTGEGRDASASSKHENEWSGWVSMEVFHRDMKEESERPDKWARRGQISWERLKAYLD